MMLMVSLLWTDMRFLLGKDKAPTAIVGKFVEGHIAMKYRSIVRKPFQKYVSCVLFIVVGAPFSDGGIETEETARMKDGQ